MQTMIGSVDIMLTIILMFATFVYSVWVVLLVAAYGRILITHPDKLEMLLKVFRPINWGLGVIAIALAASAMHLGREAADASPLVVDGGLAFAAIALIVSILMHVLAKRWLEGFVSRGHL